MGRGDVMCAWLIELFHTEGLQNTLHNVSDHMAALNKNFSTFYKASTYICILTKPPFETFLLPLTFFIVIEIFLESLPASLRSARPQHVWCVSVSQRTNVPSLASYSTSRLFINIAAQVTCSYS